MKPIFIKFTDSEGKTTNTFSACTIKAGAMDAIFDIAEKADEIDNSDIRSSREVLNDMKALIVAVFDNKFTYDQLNNGVDIDELTRVFNDLTKAINPSSPNVPRGKR